MTEKQVGEIIMNLKGSHAYGIDIIDEFTVKLAAGMLIPVITHVINLSLSSTRFPVHWKLVRILPLLKGNEMDSSNPSSYRPVSQLPVLSKLAERAVQVQVLKYLEETQQISSHHHAYRTNHNTTTALLHLTESIATGIDNNCMTATLNVDLTAAFDCVPHALLLENYIYMDWTLVQSTGSVHI